MTSIGFSLELETGALTCLAGLPVVAACRHGETVVASDGERLYRVGGDSDDGALIAWRLTLPATDCGLAGPKRLVGVSLEGVLGGQVDVQALSDSGAVLEGVAGPAGTFGEPGLPGRAVARLGRGYGTSWRVRLAATNGEALDIGQVALTSLPLDRRPA